MAEWVRASGHSRRRRARTWSTVASMRSVRAMAATTSPRESSSSTWRKGAVRAYMCTVAETGLVASPVTCASGGWPAHRVV